MIPRDVGSSMAQKARVFSSSRNGKGTSHGRSKGGFIAANPRPLILGFLVHCNEEGVLTAVKCFAAVKGVFVVANP